MELPPDFLQDELERQTEGPLKNLLKDMRFEDPLSEAMGRIENQMEAPYRVELWSEILRRERTPISLDRPFPSAANQTRNSAQPLFQEALEPDMPQEQSILRHAPSPGPPVAEDAYLGFVQIEPPRFGRIRPSRAGIRVPQDDSEIYCFKEHQYQDKQQCEDECSHWDEESRRCCYDENEEEAE
jgi:hypothetical protein